MGYGTNDIDAPAVVDFIDASPGFLILWNSAIYILDALALAVLVVAVHARLHATTPDRAAVARALGLIWAALVIGAGTAFASVRGRAVDRGSRNRTRCCLGQSAGIAFCNPRISRPTNKKMKTRQVGRVCALVRLYIQGGFIEPDHGSQCSE